MTETSPVITICDKNDTFHKKAVTVGKTMPQTEIKIVNPETFEILPWGETGEICARGFPVMNGYWQDDAKTKEAIINGWMRTGDIGHFDDDGYVKIVGRAKDMIIRGGENIYPKELEEFYMKHPNVADVQVVGVHDDFMGEEVCAWIKLKEAGKNKAEEFHEYCSGQIAHYKIPRYIRIVSDFPLTVTGKVKKNEMRHITNEMIKKKDPSIVWLKKAKKTETQTG
jgi:fatty-acyl-CoA synthase